MNKITAMIIDPNAEKVLKMKEIENTLKSLQSIVGGNIENTFRWETGLTYAMESNIVSFDLYTDEEAKLKDFDCAFILVDEKGNQQSPILVGKGVIVGSNTEGESVSADPMELMKLVKVQTITKAQPNWEKLEEIIKEELNGGFYVG